jgi:hypothetical protein
VVVQQQTLGGVLSIAGFVVIAIFLIGVMRPFTLKILADLSGWSQLAECYSTPEWPGGMFRFQGARIGQVNMNGTLDLFADSQCLSLYPVPFFRVRHPPLRIPWSDVSAVRRKRFFKSWVALSFSRAPGVVVMISESLARRLARASGGTWREELWSA